MSIKEASAAKANNNQMPLKALLFLIPSNNAPKKLTAIVVACIKLIMLRFSINGEY